MTSQRGSWWSITINNPEQADRDALANPPAFVKKVVQQDERGENDTLHIQACANTAQVRFAQVKSWLPRAHIELARDKSALLKYVQKEETAVAGTQKTIEREYVTMAGCLKKLVKYHSETPAEMLIKHYKGDIHKANAGEFWSMANQLLEEEPELVSVVTNPQVLRAWVHTKNVWLKYKTNAQDQALQSSEEADAPSPSSDETANGICSGVPDFTAIQ